MGGRSTPSRTAEHMEQAMALLETGNAKARAGQWTGAAENFRSATQLNPVFAEAHHNLSIALSHLHDEAGAYASAMTASEHGSNSVVFLLNLGNTALRIDDLDAAENAFRAALLLSPHNPAIHGNLGMSLCRRQDWNRAIEHLIKSTDDASAAAPQLFPLAMAYRNQGHLDKGLQTIERFLTAHPSSEDGQLERAQILSDLSRWEETAAAAERILSNNPNKHEAGYLLANALYEEDDLDQALAVVETILSSDPGHFAATSLVAKIFHRRGREKERTAEVLYNYRAAKPDDFRGALLLGIFLNETADYAKALEQYEQTLALSPDRPEALERIGRLYYFLREYDKARFFLEKSLDHNPDSSIGIRHLADLNITTGRLRRMGPIFGPTHL